MTDPAPVMTPRSDIRDGGSPLSRPTSSGDILWKPNAASAQKSNLARYEKWLEKTYGLRFSDYAGLWHWSTREPGAFWESIARYFSVHFHHPSWTPLVNSAVEGASWFPGATLNYAEHALLDRREGEVALLFETEPGPDGVPRREEISRLELARRVGAAARGLRRMGVQRGDRVGAYLSNTPEAVIAFLASASIGAIWSNCSAELSSSGALDRLAQIAPKVLIACAGYRYSGRYHDRHEAVLGIAAGLSSLQHLVWIGDQPPGGTATASWQSLWWNEWLEREDNEPLVFESVPFDHPLWILYSSGTTGLPKAIVQSHGGILLEHLKSLSLHLDLRPGERFFWHTASGWMMWNFLISGLLFPGVTVVLYDGSPKYPNLDTLWAFIDRNQVAYFGTSAPFLMACLKEGLAPGRNLPLDQLRAVGSTGAPLPVEGFAWVHDRVKSSIPVVSISGGTDVCTAFLLGHPDLPVRAGEIQCIGLGAAVESWDDEGRPVPPGQIGELVLTAPLPSMPTGFWKDSDGSRMWAAYFERFPGVWHHGDWLEIGSPAERCIIHGRSDATLNRGGVRMGSAEFYRIVEEMPEIRDSLIINLCLPGRGDQLILFVALRNGVLWDEGLRRRIEGRLRQEGSPRHVPDELHALPDLPRTLNGKKLEVPIKRILSGTRFDHVVSRVSLANPDALDYFIQRGQREPSL